MRRRRAPRRGCIKALRERAGRHVRARVSPPTPIRGRRAHGADRRRRRSCFVSRPTPPSRPPSPPPARRCATPALPEPGPCRRRPRRPPRRPAPEPVRWAPGAATGVGSLPGTDPVEAAATVVGELPLLPHLPELPARGVGADMIGRTAGAAGRPRRSRCVPTGWRVTARPGRDHRARRRPPALRRRRPRHRLRGRRVPSGSRSRPRGRGRSRRRSSCTPGTGRSPTAAPSASSPPAWRRGCARTSRRSRNGPARACSSSSTSRACPRCWPASLPTASGWGTVRVRPGAGRPGPAARAHRRARRARSSCTAAPRTRPCGCWPRPARPAIGIDATLPAVSGDTASRRPWTRWARSGTPGSRCCSAWSRPAAARLAVAIAAASAGRTADPARPRGRPSTVRALARRAFDLADRLGLRPRAPRRPGRPHPDLRPRRGHAAWARRAMRCAASWAGVRRPTGDLDTADVTARAGRRVRIRSALVPPVMSECSADTAMSVRYGDSVQCAPLARAGARRSPG